MQVLHAEAWNDAIKLITPNLTRRKIHFLHGYLSINVARDNVVSTNEHLVRVVEREVLVGIDESDIDSIALSYLKVERVRRAVES